MTSENEDRMHELLCAYVLGEGTEDERAEVEAALGQSAELRAELERIEATIGLVRGAMGGAETLSSEATAEILSAAAPRKRLQWHRVLPLRIAAGIALAFAAFGIYALSAHYAGWRAAPEQPRDERAAGDKKDEQVAMVSKNEKLGVPGLADAHTLDRNVVGGDSASSHGEGGPFKQEARALRELGYTTDSSEVFVYHVMPDAEESSRRGAGTSDSTAVLSAPKRQDLLAHESVSYGYKENVPVTAATEAAPPALDQLSESKSIPFGGRKIGSEIGKGRTGGLTGAGPSSGGSVAVSTTPSGPSSAGPSAAAIPAPIEPGHVSGGDFFLEAAAEGAVETAFERLRGLGYLGDDERQGSWTPEQRERYLDEECRRIFTGCYRRPNERPRDMFFRFWGDNPFEIAALDAQSTFSIDVDTASYALVRRYLNEGNIPTKAQIRTEEFVNYFKADVPAPREGTFAIHTDLAPSRFSADAQRWMLRVVVRGREVAKTERKPLALTFVIDVSGSMREQNRLEMVKHTLRLLLSQLDANDSIAMVAFSNEARMILPMTSGGNRGLIESALFPLQPSGSTNSQAGLKMGYEAALAGLNPNATNRVVFLSDGVANVGVTDPNEITNEVQRIREKGIYLNTVGVGMNNHNDVLLEQLADKGDGVCNYVDTAEEAKRVMVDGFTGAFEPIARDVKVQIEFDPAQVARYRLLGYENRAIADKDFRNDKVDAGEIGAGHQVTALYEIERTGAGAEKPLASVRLRWKAPRQAGPSADAETEQAAEIEQSVLASQVTSFEGAGAGYRRAVIVAQFAELLRRSQHARGESLDDLLAEVAKLKRETLDKDLTELHLLMQKSKALILASRPPCDELCETIDLVRHNQILRAENELLAKDQDAKLVDELERQNRELEQRIRDLLRRRLETR